MADNDKHRIIVIGAGPTGIGAAYHLHKRGYQNWELLERNNYAGGHSGTHVDDQGFLWDEGGHVLHSHYEYYDQFVEESLGGEYYQHERESWVKYRDAWVPYPFQNNIRHLAPEDQQRCVDGLEAVHGKPDTSKNFKEWIYQIFGAGIAEKFMMPYNFKVWATPTELMDKNWIAERVSVIDLARVKENIQKQRDDVSWGPNNLFKFPKRGGTGEIYRRAALKLDDKIMFNTEVVRIHATDKRIELAGGSTVSYDFLVSPIPLPELFSRIVDAPAELKAEAQKLTSNGIYIIGIGVEKKIATTKCWVYFPEDVAPFYRLTYFHHYSPFNVPDGNTDKYSSFMCEVSYSPHKKVDQCAVVEDTVNGLIAHGILEESDRDKIVSKALYTIPYGYPVPTLDRDEILKKLQSWLMTRGIYSRGRFGAWRYEIANMDHCFMQGVEAIDAILDNKAEETWES